MPSHRHDHSVGLTVTNVDDALSLRKELEGPAVLRLLGAAGGAAMCVSAVLAVLHFHTALSHPATLILKIYEFVFGMTIVVTELKDVEYWSWLREFFYKWFPFLTVTQGKGFFYLFAGSLGASFYHNLILFIPAMVTAGIGVLYLSVYFGKKGEKDEKFDQSFILTRAPMPV